MSASATLPVGRLRRSDCSGPGIGRRHYGRGFGYIDPEGGRVADEDTLERIRGLAIPPARKDVWICNDPYGHIQATGLDEAGRKQTFTMSAGTCGRRSASSSRCASSLLSCQGCARQ